MGIWIPGGLKGDSGENYVPPSWSTGTDEEIVEALEKHYNDEVDLTEYWSVGDERTVNLSAMTAGSSISTSYPVAQSAQTVTYVILDIGGKELVTPINGHTECAFVVGQKNKLSTSSSSVMTIKWSGSGTTKYGFFQNTLAKTWLNEKYYYAIPETFRTIFKQFKNKGFYIKNYIMANADYYQGVSGGTTNYVLFSLPTLKEARGTSSVLGEENLTQFEYYTTTANYTNSIKNCYYGSYNATNTIGSTTQKKPYYDKNGTLTEGSGTYGILPFGVI